MRLQHLREQAALARDLLSRLQIDRENGGMKQRLEVGRVVTVLIERATRRRTHRGDVESTVVDGRCVQLVGKTARRSAFAIGKPSIGDWTDFYRRLDLAAVDVNGIDEPFAIAVDLADFPMGARQRLREEFGRVQHLVGVILIAVVADCERARVSQPLPAFQAIAEQLLINQALVQVDEGAIRERLGVDFADRAFSPIGNEDDFARRGDRDAGRLGAHSDLVAGDSRTVPEVVDPNELLSFP